jgi:hypothetical protein
MTPNDVSGKRAGRWGPSRGPVLAFREGRDAAAGMRRLREAKGLSGPELAARLGVGVMWVRQREQGSIRMTRAEAEQVAAEFGTDYEGLTGGAA